MNLGNNANIRMIVKQTADGATDSSELFTKGEFREHGGSYFIDYDESEATGYEGSHYGTEYGDCMIGISTNELRNGITGDGGEIYVRYTIDVNSGLMLTNEITIHVKPHGNEI